MQTSEMLAAELDRLDDLERQDLLDIFGRLGEPLTVKLLLDALHNQDVSVRADSVVKLRELGEERIVAPIIQALDKTTKLDEVSARGEEDDETADLLYTGVEALRIFAHASAVDILVQVLKNWRQVIREKAAETLGKLGNVRAVPALVQSLADESHWVRYAAVVALGEIKDTAAINPVARLLDDPDRQVAYFAAKTLGALGAVLPLIEATRHNNWEIRQWVAERLGDLPNPVVKAPLQSLLEDERQEVRTAAKWALVKLKNGTGSSGI